MNNPSFVPLNLDNVLNFQHAGTKVFGMLGDQMMYLEPGGSWFVFVHEGRVLVNGAYMLHAGMYASMSKGDLYSLDGSKALIVRQEGPDAMWMVGGPIEERGRLRYIDGCTDSLLVPPVKLGNPCLNYLHFPPKTDQTMHTHPSLRVGLVFGGSGLCLTPFGDVPLVPGMVFAILPENGRVARGLDGKPHAEGLHCFRTYGEEMRIVAFHPTSDYGPTDEDHPMMNQTIINGAPASVVSEIHTT